MRVLLVPSLQHCFADSRVSLEILGPDDPSLAADGMDKVDRAIAPTCREGGLYLSRCPSMMWSRLNIRASVHSRGR